MISVGGGRGKGGWEGEGGGRGGGVGGEEGWEVEGEGEEGRGEMGDQLQGPTKIHGPNWGETKKEVLGEWHGDRTICFLVESDRSNRFGTGRIEKSDRAESHRPSMKTGYCWIMGLGGGQRLTF